MWGEKARMAVLREHLNNDFDYLTNKTLRYHPEGRGGPSVKMGREGPEMRREHYRKCIILDMDGLVNRPGSPAPFELYLEYLTDKVPYLKDARRDIFENIRMLEKGADSKTHADNISYHFRKGGLTWSLHKEAAKYAADNLRLSSNLPSAVDRLYRMGYEPFILSASPDKVVEYCRDRIHVKEGNTEASEFVFGGSEGLFQGMIVNLDGTRAQKRDRIMDRSVLTKKGIEVMVDDNPHTGKKIVKSGWNHVYFWARGAPPMPDNISVEMPELRRDFEKIVDKIKKLERGLAITIVMDESGYKKSIEVADSAVEYGTEALKSHGEGFEDAKLRFVSKLREYDRGMHDMFHSNGIRLQVRLKDIELDRNEASARSKVRVLLYDFQDRSLEAKMHGTLY